MDVPFSDQEAEQISAPTDWLQQMNCFAYSFGPILWKVEGDKWNDLAQHDTWLGCLEIALQRN
jgi:hypothetical protein